MESFYEQTTVACAMLPAAFSTKFDSVETMFNLHYQIVLRVGDDANLIEEKWRPQFYKYLASCVKICGGRVEAMGGAPDQVHLLIALCSAKALAQFLRELKLLSQTWVRRKLQIPDFAWQDGSEAFTVSVTQLERVKAFIQRRDAHYRQRSVREECA
jgi:REP element-mobilizing transposase RayT